MMGNGMEKKHQKDNEKKVTNHQQGVRGKNEERNLDHQEKYF